MKPSKNEADTAKKVMSIFKEVMEQVKKGRNDKAVQVAVKDAMSIAKEQMGKKKSDDKNGGHKNYVQPAQVYVQSPHGYGQPQAHGSNQEYYNPGQAYGSGDHGTGSHGTESHGHSIGSHKKDSIVYGGHSHESHGQGNHSTGAHHSHGGHQNQGGHHKNSRSHGHH